MRAPHAWLVAFSTGWDRLSTRSATLIFVAVEADRYSQCFCLNGLYWLILVHKKDKKSTIMLKQLPVDGFNSWLRLILENADDKNVVNSYGKPTSNCIWA